MEDGIIGAIDQGTSSSRFLVFSIKTKELIASHQIELPRICAQQGWCEQDANLLLSTVIKCIDETTSKLSSMGIDAPKLMRTIGLATQRVTIIAWDKVTGEPLHNSITWCDTRTSPQVEEILREQPETAERIREISGVPVSNLPSASKIAWMLDNLPNVKAALEENRLSIGNTDAWMLWKLTGQYVTDISNASFTQLMNLKTCSWDPFLCSFFKVPIDILPEIRSCSEVYGTMLMSSLKGTPVSSCLGDQQAALVGQKCFLPGSAKCTYGTGCFLLLNTGTEMTLSKHGLITLVAYQMGPKSPVVYCTEGSVAVAGSGIRWLRDNLGLASTYEEMDRLVTSVPDSGGVYFVPAFSGLYAPYWSSDARGVICGLTEHATKGHLARAGFDSVCFQVRDVIDAFTEDSGQLKSVKVDGGMTRNAFLMQLQADLAGIPITRAEEKEATALGAALAAGAASGIDLWTLDQLVKEAEAPAEGTVVFKPQLCLQAREQRYFKWKEAVKRSMGWEVQL